MEGMIVTKKFAFPKNNWMILSIALIILLGVSILFSSGITGFVGKDLAGKNAMAYINSNFGVKPELIGVTEENGMYLIAFTVQGSPYEMHMTKNGNLMFPQVFDLSGAVETDQPAQTNQPSQPIAVPKSDKPIVEVFWMAECPYGLQAMKGVMPAVENLGGGIDFKLRFVYYAMHGEPEVLEQLNQYCIQEEQNSKLIDYLKCFLEAGDSEKCLTETNIDKSKLTKCTEKADEQFDISKNLEDKSSWLSGRFPLFDIDKALNEKYGVGGSPTLVINGVQSSSARDSASLLNAICGAFNDKPSECNVELSTAAPSAGFGYGTGTGTEGQCG